MTKQVTVKKIPAFGGTHRTGTIQGIPTFGISDLLGFGPNVDGDPDKVVNSWAAEVDGVRIAIWDYKRSQDFNQFSTFGPAEALRSVFGPFYKDEH